MLGLVHAGDKPRLTKKKKKCKKHVASYLVVCRQTSPVALAFNTLPHSPPCKIGSATAKRNRSAYCPIADRRFADPLCLHRAEEGAQPYRRVSCLYRLGNMFFFGWGDGGRGLLANRSCLLEGIAIVFEVIFLRCWRCLRG